jgi:hypothetical protein
MKNKNLILVAFAFLTLALAPLTFAQDGESVWKKTEFGFLNEYSMNLYYDTLIKGCDQYAYQNGDKTLHESDRACVDSAYDALRPLMGEKLSEFRLNGKADYRIVIAAAHPLLRTSHATDRDPNDNFTYSNCPDPHVFNTLKLSSQSLFVQVNCDDNEVVRNKAVRNDALELWLSSAKVSE